MNVNLRSVPRKVPEPASAAGPPCLLSKLFVLAMLVSRRSSGKLAYTRAAPSAANILSREPKSGECCSALCVEKESMARENFPQGHGSEAPTVCRLLPGPMVPQAWLG